MTGVTLNNVVKKYGDVQVIHGVNLEVKDGEFCVFVGPSGCGKSTLLRMVAGLEETTAGAINIGNRDVTKSDPSERGVAMVFQTYALYPHMTVAENMGFGLKMTGHPKADIDRKVAEATRILKLEDYLTRKPKALSGGQRQRVAIGRARGVFIRRTAIKPGRRTARGNARGNRPSAPRNRGHDDLCDA
jgi:lactose/L-arabinose transport system ATP-binding protein